MAQYKKKKKKLSKSDSRRGIRIVWISFAAFWVFLVLFFTMLSLGWLGFMPSFEELENPRSNLASEVWSADGEVLGYIGIQSVCSECYVTNIAVKKACRMQVFPRNVSTRHRRLRQSSSTIFGPN